MLTDTAEKVEQTSVPAERTPVVLTDVTKRYGRRRRAVPALDRVSLSFGAGSFTAVLGVSGSGKSTLLQCAAGLERPSAGTVRLCGTDLAGLVSWPGCRAWRRPRPSPASPAGWSRRVTWTWSR
jgi:ABC-type Fe3+/spermidine/putrescine transport system ATPase subunit